MKIHVDNSILFSAFCECFNMSISDLTKEFNIRNKHKDYCTKKKLYYVGELDWKESAISSNFNTLEVSSYKDFTKHIKEQGLTMILDQLWLRTMITPFSRSGSKTYIFIQNRVLSMKGKKYLDYGGALGIEPITVSQNFDYVYLAEIDNNAFKFARHLADLYNVKNLKTVNSDKIRFLKKKNFDCITSIYSMDCFPFNEAVKRLTYLLKHCREFYGIWGMENNKQRLSLGEICANNTNKKLERIMPIPRSWSISYIH